jgi:hypothetical protein
VGANLASVGVEKGRPSISSSASFFFCERERLSASKLELAKNWREIASDIFELEKPRISHVANVTVSHPKYFFCILNHIKALRKTDLKLGHLASDIEDVYEL